MNTLGKEITKTFFKTETGFDDLEKHWAALVNSDEKNKLSSKHYLLYAALRGKDWRKGLTPTTSEKKLNNGGVCNGGYYQAYHSLMNRYGASREELLAPFKEFITDEAFGLITRMLPKPELTYGKYSECAPSLTMPDYAYLELAKEN